MSERTHRGDPSCRGLPPQWRKNGTDPSTSGAPLSLDRPVALVGLDGVLCQGEHLLPGAKSFVRGMMESQISFLLLSNDSRRSVEQWKDMFSRNGLTLATEHFLSSAEATTLCLAATAPPGARVLVLGGDGLNTDLEEHGFEIVDSKPDIVAVGHDPLVSYASLTNACRAVAQGALLIGTNADRTVVGGDGLEIPGPGASLAWLEAATGQPAIVVGMPQPLMYHLALERLDVSASDVTLIGDALDAEIAGAQLLSIHTVVALSGRTTVSALRRCMNKPDRIIREVGDLLSHPRPPTVPRLYAVR